jgi:hypothetical protein
VGGGGAGDQPDLSRPPENWPPRAVVDAPYTPMPLVVVPYTPLPLVDLPTTPDPKLFWVPITPEP